MEPGSERLVLCVGGRARPRAPGVPDLVVDFDRSGGDGAGVLAEVLGRAAEGVTLRELALRLRASGDDRLLPLLPLLTGGRPPDAAVLRERLVACDGDGVVWQALAALLGTALARRRVLVWVGDSIESAMRAGWHVLAAGSNATSRIALGCTEPAFAGLRERAPRLFARCEVLRDPSSPEALAERAAEAVRRVAELEAAATPPEERALAESMARSAAEAYLAAVLDADRETAGRFELNASPGFVFGGRPCEVDLLCRAPRVAIEIDGHWHFAGADAFRRDRRKDVALQRHGFLVLRFLAGDVVARLESILATIRESLRCTMPQPFR